MAIVASRPQHDQHCTHDQQRCRRRSFDVQATCPAPEQNDVQSFSSGYITNVVVERQGASDFGIVTNARNAIVDVDTASDGTKARLKLGDVVLAVDNKVVEAGQTCLTNDKHILTILRGWSVTL